MGAGGGREGDRRARPPRASAAPAGPPSAQSLLQDVAVQLAMLDDVGDPAGDDAPGPVAERAGRDASRRLRSIQRDVRETDALLEALVRDVRVALTVVKGRAQLLRRQAFATGAPDRRLIRSVDEIDRAVTRIDWLLRERPSAES